MTDYSVDVLGAFEKEDTDPIIIAIKRLVEEHGDLVIKYVKLTQEQREAQTECSADRAAIAARGVLWPKFKLERKKK